MMMTTKSSPSPVPLPQLGPDLLDAAQRALEDQRWDDALAQVQRALRGELSDAERAEALLLVGRCHWHRGELLGVHPAALQAAALAQQAERSDLQVQALNLASLSLSELGLADEALPLTANALLLAQVPDLHQLLPSTLSYAAHVHARLGDVDNAEVLHMRALSLARESGQVLLLQQAYCNLFVSFNLAHEEIMAQSGAEAASAALAHAQRYIGHSLSLLQDERLDETRQATLMLGAGHLLMLYGQLDEAEPLLQRCIAISSRLGARYYLLSAQQSLGELMLRRGRPAEGLALLEESLNPAPGQGGFSLQLAALRTAVACQLALGRLAAAAASADARDAALRARDAMRQQARASFGQPGN